jgi:tetratricopeptide (TPR) repeat protein
MTLMLLIGGLSLLFGMWQLGLLLQFYLGQRRDLYFYLDRVWLGMGRMGGSLSLIGASLIAVALLPTSLSRLSMALVSFTITIAWWIGAPTFLRWNPPRWVREFEASRPPDDLQAILQNGTAMLILRPGQFQRMVREAHGWESWVMTVTSPVPIALLDTYIKRVEMALQLNLSPLAVEAADQIIAYRGDHPMGYELRAKAHAHNHRYEEALADLARCIEIAPKSAVYYQQRARLYITLNQPKEALENLEIALCLKPDSSELLKLRETLLKHPLDKAVL